MSTRWFRHYAGMMREPKFVGVAARSKQPIERVAFVWACMLESAAECQEQGSFVLDNDEVAYFLRCDVSEIIAIRTELEDVGVIDGTNVTKWLERQHESDTSTSRTRRYREKKRHGDVPETLSGGSVTAPETETETEKISLPSEAHPADAGPAPEEGSSTNEEEPDDIPSSLDRREYPQAYVELWDLYREEIGEKNSSKSVAFQRWKKLIKADQDACYFGLVEYCMWAREERKKRADVPLKHLEVFINKRSWEPYLETAA